MLYEQLDRLRQRASGYLSETLISGVATSDQGMSERDSAAAEWSRRLAQLNAAENGLCFGRLDLDDGERRYIGRIGIFDDEGDYEPLLMDWRAPAARPFYLATAAPPQGVRRRRHIRTRRREVTGVDDEVLDLDRPAGRPGTRGPDRRGGAAGRAQRRAAPAGCATSSRPSRPSRTRSSAPTLQRRAGRAGRPGHRQDRGRAAPRRLPALHATGEQLASARRADRRAEPDLPALHRRRCCRRWARPACCCRPSATCSRASPRDRPRAGGGRRDQGPAGDGRRAGRPRSGTGSGCRTMRWCWSSTARRLRLDRPRRSGAPAPGPPHRRPHNVARPVFVEQIVAALAAEYAGDLGERTGAGRSLAGVAGELDLDRSAAQLGDHDAVLAALDELWPMLTPQRLLADLFTSSRADRPPPDCPMRTPSGCAGTRRRLDRRRRAAAGRGGRAARRGRPGRPGAGRGGRRRQEIELRAGRAGHRLRLRSLDRRLEDGRTPRCCPPSTSSTPTGWPSGTRRSTTGTPAERAAADRTWAFGHVDRRRGAGAVADGLAAADAPLPEPVDDAGRRRRADRRPGRRAVLGGGARRRTSADRWRLDRADRQLPHPGRDHGGRGRTCWPRSTRDLRAAAVGAGDRRTSRGRGAVTAGDALPAVVEAEAGRRVGRRPARRDRAGGATAGRALRGAPGARPARSRRPGRARWSC